MQRRSWNTTAAKVAATTLAGLLMLGCDRPTELSELQPAEPPAPARPAKPTTQELLTGEMVRVPLKIIPFSVQTPKSWTIEPIGGVNFLEGPTPAGTARIQIGRHPSPIKDHATLLIEGARKDAAAHPGPYTKADVREVGGVRMLETRSVGNTLNSPAIDTTGEIMAPTSTPLRWKVSAFVPNGRDHDVCEIHFSDLTVEQYERDKELLDKIVASFEYDTRVNPN